MLAQPECCQCPSLWPTRLFFRDLRQMDGLDPEPLGVPAASPSSPKKPQARRDGVGPATGFLGAKDKEEPRLYGHPGVISRHCQNGRCCGWTKSQSRTCETLEGRVPRKYPQTMVVHGFLGDAGFRPSTVSPVSPTKMKAFHYH